MVTRFVFSSVAKPAEDDAHNIFARLKLDNPVAPFVVGLDSALDAGFDEHRRHGSARNDRAVLVCDAPADGHVVEVLRVSRRGHERSRSRECQQ